ncbi:MAG: DUF4286 family protein [Anaerolineae bacterium]
MSNRPIYFVRLKLDPTQEAAFNEWYDHEYLDTLRPIAPLFVNIYRYAAGEGADKTYLTIYEIKDEASIDEALSVFDAPERASSRVDWKAWEAKAVTEIQAGVFHQIYPQ